MKTEKNIFIAFILNLLFSIFEIIGGIMTRSISIISDAIHDFGDALSIGIAYFLERLSIKNPDEVYTYGYKRYSVLGAVITNAILFMGAILVIYNAIIRIINPVTINYNGMIIFGIIGFIVNLIASFITRNGNSLNQKAVNLHMFEDVLGWAIVLIGAIIMKFTDLSIIDPIMSILVSLYILTHVVKHFETILNVFLEKTPINISLDNIRKELLKIKDIKDVHHIHIWTLDGFNNYATMHIISDNNDVKKQVRKKLLELNINHVTLELESLEEKCEHSECNKSKELV